MREKGRQPVTPVDRCARFSFDQCDAHEPLLEYPPTGRGSEGRRGEERERGGKS